MDECVTDEVTSLLPGSLMNESYPDAEKLAKLRKMARVLGLNFFLGLLGVVLSFSENSPFWSCFVVLTAWIGVVMGLTGGPGFADYLLGRVPPHRHVSKAWAILLSLGTFWIPTLATAVFGMVLAGALRVELQPQSFRDDQNVNLLFQIFAMYFISAGTSWSIVGHEVKKVQREVEAEQ